MMPLNKPLVFVLVVLCAIEGCFSDQIPDYIDVCKRDQDTIDDCVLKSVEKLRPYLAQGIPELNVPGIEPLYIPEIVVESGDVVHFQAIGRDVQVSGAANFSIKNVHVDLDSLTIRARVRFPKLHFDGRYSVDARLLVVPLQGQGKIIADAVKCDAELVLHSKLVERDGVEFIKFENLDMDINVKDYRVKLEGLFNGDKTLGKATNDVINQNRGEFLRATKPYLERTVARILLNIANKIASTFPFDDLLPVA